MPPYHRACWYAGPDPTLPPAKQEAARRQQQHAYEQELMQLWSPYVRTSAPMHTLCERVERFLPELFVFVAVRKISGGTRSPNGADTRMALFSLFGKWATQGLNPFLQCLAALSHYHSFL